MTPRATTRERRKTRPKVGAQIRRLRTDRGVTLAEVAVETGLNVGYLSQVETDKASPSLETLAAIGRALDVPITWFFSEFIPPPFVVRGRDRRHKSSFGARVEIVDGGMPRSLRIVEASLPRGGRTPVHVHPGEEHHVVLSGRIRLSQGDHSVELGPGDYLVWDATLPHTAEQIGEEPARVLIITPGPQHSWTPSSPTVDNA
ncbi:MAG TPA: XRE family transcriptional regulator [Actinomycetota bacterium]|nr:XRE family transcriptional regulator [Actinomycetota bacterium]